MTPPRVCQHAVSQRCIPTRPQSNGRHPVADEAHEKQTWEPASSIAERRDLNCSKCFQCSKLRIRSFGDPKHRSVGGAFKFSCGSLKRRCYEPCDSSGAGVVLNEPTVPATTVDADASADGDADPAAVPPSPLHPALSSPMIAPSPSIRSAARLLATLGRATTSAGRATTSIAPDRDRLTHRPTHRPGTTECAATATGDSESIAAPGSEIPPSSRRRTGQNRAGDHDTPTQRVMTTHDPQKNPSLQPAKMAQKRLVEAAKSRTEAAKSFIAAAALWKMWTTR